MKKGRMSGQGEAFVLVDLDHFTRVVLARRPGYRECSSGVCLDQLRVAGQGGSLLDHRPGAMPWVLSLPGG
jgi:hypothetical protein